jgi:hypothetical protein
VRAAPVVVAVLLEGVARAGGGPPTDAYDGISDDRTVDVHLFADLFVAHDFGDPPSGESQLRAFDSENDALALGWLRVRIAHKPDRFGFRVDLGAGATSGVYFDSDPASLEHPTLSRWLSHVGQAFATVVTGPSNSVTIDAGKFDTPIGLEDNEAATNWNYSRSFLYTWAEPSLHTGVRALYEVSPTFSVAAFWLNGWNANVVDGSSMRSYAVAARWRPRDAVEVVVVYAGGLERPPDHSPPLSFRNELDAYTLLHPTEWLSFAATADAGHDAARGGVSFYGLGGYARAEVRSWLAVALRGEAFGDPEGFMTGTPQSLAEITGTVEVKRTYASVAVTGRLEYRHDHSSADVFEHAVGFRQQQDTLTAALLASW